MVFCHGGLVAMQTVWAPPRMVRLAGYSPLEAAGGLFWINCAWWPHSGPGTWPASDWSGVDGMLIV